MSVLPFGVLAESVDVAAVGNEWAASLNEAASDGTLVIDQVQTYGPFPTSSFDPSDTGVVVTSLPIPVFTPSVPVGSLGLFLVEADEPASFAMPDYGFIAPVGPDGPGYQYLADVSSAPVTIAGGDLTLLSLLGEAGGAYALGPSSQSVVAGGGDWLLGTPTTPPAATPTYTFLLDDGNDTVVAATGNVAITTHPGASTILDATSGTTMITLGGSDGIDLTGTGATTIAAYGPGVTAFGGAGTLELDYRGFGAVNVIGGSGSHSISAGFGGGILQGGTDGNNLIAGGVGVTSIQGAGAGDTLLAGSGVTTISAGSGNETLSAAGQAANDFFTTGLGANDADRVIGGNGRDTIFAGGGADTLTGGAGADQFVFASQYTDGGTVTITDFTPGLDQIVLSNYGAGQVDAAVTSFSGGALTLADGTRIVLDGVAGVTAQNFTTT